MCYSTNRATVESDLVRLCSPRSHVELAIIRSVLRSEEIDHFVSNDFFGSLYIGPSFLEYNQKSVWVRPSDLEAAKALTSTPITDNDFQVERGFTFFEKLRMSLEALFFNWVVPAAGRLRKRNRSRARLKEVGK